MITLSLASTVRENRQPDLFGGFEIYHEFEPRWLLDGQIRGLAL